MINYGKKFEERFKLDWTNSIEDSCIIRLYDNTSGYLSISNISDFICYKQPNIFFIECKSHKGASIPFDDISQYNKLIQVAGIPGVRAGIVLWLYEKDKVFLQLNYLQNGKNIFLCTPESAVPVKQENESKLSDEQKKVLKQVVKEIIKERTKNYVFGENTKE